jgi:hypothetical protein
MHNPIMATFDERRGVFWCGSGNDVDVGGELVAEVVEGKVVYVVAEGVLDFLADVGEAEDYVCGDWVDVVSY